jgi:plasmid stability protein
MPSLTIKDIPDQLLTRLRQRAASEQRSLNREVIHLLDRVLSEAPAAPVSVALTERIEAQVQAWRTLAGRWDSGRGGHHLDHRLREGGRAGHDDR